MSSNTFWLFIPFYECSLSPLSHFTCCISCLLRPLTPSESTLYCCIFLTLLGEWWWHLYHLGCMALPFVSWWGSVSRDTGTERGCQNSLLLPLTFQALWWRVADFLSSPHESSAITTPNQRPRAARPPLPLQAVRGRTLLSALSNAIIKMYHQKHCLTC